MVSLSKRSMRPSGGVPLAGGVLVVVSIASSVLAMGALPETMRIHWTLGAGPYYGPEFAPTAAVLVLFPVLVAALFVGGCLLGELLDGTAEFEAMRPYYERGAVLTLAAVVAVQFLVVWLNLP